MIRRAHAGSMPALLSRRRMWRLLLLLIGCGLPTGGDGRAGGEASTSTRRALRVSQDDCGCLRARPARAAVLDPVEVRAVAVERERPDVDVALVEVGGRALAVHRKGSAVGLS